MNGETKFLTRNVFVNHRPSLQACDCVRRRPAMQRAVDRRGRHGVGLRVGISSRPCSDDSFGRLQHGNLCNGHGPLCYSPVIASFRPPARLKVNAVVFLLMGISRGCAAGTFQGSVGALPSIARRRANETNVTLTVVAPRSDSWTGQQRTLSSLTRRSVHGWGYRPPADPGQNPRRGRARQ